MTRKKSSNVDDSVVELIVFILILPFFIIAKTIVVLLNLILNGTKKKKDKKGSYNVRINNYDTYCSKCGSKANSNHNYCLNCGNQLDSYDSDNIATELDNLGLEDWEKEEVKKGNFDPLNFEEEDELEDDDFYESGEE